MTIIVFTLKPFLLIYGTYANPTTQRNICLCYIYFFVGRMWTYKSGDTFDSINLYTDNSLLQKHAAKKSF